MVDLELDNFQQEKSKNILFKIKTFFINFYNKYRQGLITLGVLALVAYAIVLYSYVTNYFTVSLSGDYYLQSMTFNYLTYDMWHEFFATGHFPLFDNHSFLGISNIGGNSFYMMFNPWYLATLIFPRSWQTFLQGLMFPIKLIVGGMGCYCLLKEFKLKYSTCRLFAIAYAFCGYNIMYFWFQFNDSSAFLPFVILGIERVLRDKDLRILLISLILVGFTNFFMLANFLLGGFIYAIFRLIQIGYKKNHEENIQVLAIGFVGFLLPLLTTSFIMIPSIFNALDMPRVSSASYLDKIFGAGSVFESIKQFFTFEYPHQQINPLTGFLFMPVGCYSQNIGNVSWFDNLGQSTFISMPLQLITFFSIVSAFRSKKVSHIIGILGCSFMLFTPFCYYLFSGFTVGYSRFLILIVIFIVIFDAIYFDKIKELPASNLDIAFGMYLFFIVLDIALLLVESKTNSSAHDGASYYWERFLLIPIETVYLIICYVLMRVFYKKKSFVNITTILACLEFAVAGNVTIINQGTVSLNSMGGGIDNVSHETKIVKNINNNDDTYFRLFNPYADRWNVNLGLKEGFNTTGLFNSNYPFHSQDFLDNSRIPYTYHNWSMGVHNRRPVLNSLLNIKYYLLDEDDKNIPYGYKEYRELTAREFEYLDMTYSEELSKQLTEYKKKLYVDTNYVNLIFPYENVINYDTYINNYYEYSNESYYLSYLGINKEDMYAFESFETTDTSNKLTNKLVSLSTANRYLFRPTFINNSYNVCQEDDLGCKDYYINEGVDKFNRSYKPSTLTLYLSKFGIDSTYVYDDSIYGSSVPVNNYYAKTKVLLDFSSKPICSDQEEGCYVSFLSPDNFTVKFYNKDATESFTEISNSSLEYRTTPYETSTEGAYSYSNYKLTHGYYLYEPAYYVVLEANEYIETVSSYSFYTTTYSEIQDRLDTLNSYETNVRYRSSDYIEFDTTLGKTMPVMLNIPYYPEFSLTKTLVYYQTNLDNVENPIVKTKTEEVELYNGQGGFLTFIDSYNSNYIDRYYTLTYTPKYFSIAKLVSLIGGVSSASLFMYFMVLDNKKRFYEKYFNPLKYEQNMYIDNISRLD